MKRVLGIFFIFAVGIFLGYLYSESRNKQTETRFQEANDSDYNNKESNVQPPAATPTTTASSLPTQRPATAEKKSDPYLPKAPKLVPESTPAITTNISARSRTEKKSTAEVSNHSSYPITTLGLTGTVKLIGAVKPQTFRMTPECRKQNADAEIKDDSILKSESGGLANVFISIRSGLNPKAVYPAPTEPVVLDQTGCVYSPHVYAVRVGQPFQILNSDPFLHNVNGMPKLNAKFNNGMPTKGSQIEKKFTKAEDGFRIKCDVHPWMSAYVWVVDHPYFAFTDANGKFNIPNLPYGEYVVEIQHEKLGSKEKKVVWSADSEPLEFQF